MTLFTWSLAIIVGILSSAFPSFNLFLLLAGAVTVVLVGKHVLQQGDSNEAQD